MDIFILRDGEQTGPFSEPTVQQLLTQGELRARDMAWRKGLPAWLPLTEVMNPGSEKPTAPPPVTQLSGVRTPESSKKAPTGKQKALLKYVGVEFPESASKGDVAILISDALENPKLQSRLARWNDEKLRLHSDVFADELEHRKANRSSHYVELCQTQGAGVVRDVTKAHCQVLVESLDKRFPAWEANPKDSLWHYLYPAIAEHFPTLVMEEWRSKLRFGIAPKNAPTSSTRTADSTRTGTVSPSNPLHAALRGIVYGLAALGVIISGLKLMESGKTPAPAPDASVAAKPAAPAPTPEVPTLPLAAPLIAAVAPELPPELPATTPPEPPAPVAPVAPAPVAAVPAMVETPPAPPAPVPVNPVPTGAPTLPRLDAPPAPAPVVAVATIPTAPMAPAPPKTELTLSKPVAMQLQFGKVTLPPGTRVRFLAVTPAGLKCNFNNNVIIVPPTSTDYDGPLIPTVSAPASVIPTGAPVAPVAPKPPTPSSDL